MGPFHIPRIRTINDAYIRTVNDGPHLGRIGERLIGAIPELAAAGMADEWSPVTRNTTRCWSSRSVPCASIAWTSVMSRSRSNG